MNISDLSSFPTAEKIESITGVKPCSATTRADYQAVRDVLVDWLGSECYFCGQERGEDYTLCFHHVNPEEGRNPQGGINHIRQVHKDLENGVDVELLCRSCHWKLHYLRGEGVHA